jgi:hypothetical protein
MFLFTIPEGKTFKSIGIDYTQGLTQNWKLFKDKWQLQEDIKWDDKRRFDLPDQNEVEIYLSVDMPQNAPKRPAPFKSIIHVWKNLKKERWITVDTDGNPYPIRRGDRLKIEFVEDRFIPGSLVVMKSSLKHGNVYRLLVYDSTGEKSLILKSKPQRKTYRVNNEDILGRVSIITQENRQIYLKSSRMANN